MTYRVGIAGIFHETNTYAAVTALSDFKVWHGAEIVQANLGAKTYIGGMLDGCLKLGIEVVPLMYAEATPSGPIDQQAYEQLRDEVVRLVQEHSLDGLLLPIHGAGAAQNTNSIEDDLCLTVRHVVGPDFPMVAALDLHGNLTPALAEYCSALFPGRFNPHTDQHERGVETAECINAMLAEGLAPDVYIEPIPMRFPPVPTSLAAFTALDAYCCTVEARPGVLCARLMHGFPYADVPYAGASVCVSTDGTRQSARKIAVEVAQVFWEHREQISVAAFPSVEAVALAKAQISQVVINEFSDNTGAGAPGDGTHLLRALLDADVRACFSHIFDVETVEQAKLAGVGEKIAVRLGGKHIPMHGNPIEASAEVLGLSNGQYRVKSPMGTGEVIDLGLLATLRIGKVDVIVSSGRRQTLDDGPFIKAGIDIAEFPIVGLKSSQHFRAWYTDKVSTIITADAPGLSCIDLSSFVRTSNSRDVWPLNRGVAYRPFNPEKTGGQ